MLNLIEFSINLVFWLQLPLSFSLQRDSPLYHMCKMYDSSAAKFYYLKLKIMLWGNISWKLEQ